MLIRAILAKSAHPEISIRLSGGPDPPHPKPHPKADVRSLP
jgi:hypothetical protein